jgi:hypothetical protein
MASGATLIRRYKNEDAYQKEAAQLAMAGWRVQTMTEASARPGCMRLFMLGPWAFVARPTKLIVTYVQSA